MNVVPIVTLKKLGKGKLDLISTNMKMSNFIGDVMTTIGILVANITVGSKTLSSTFFIIYAKHSYFVLLGKD